MPNWRQVIVGDAFRLPSRELSYYRDLFLACPFWLFTVASVANLLNPHADHRLLLRVVPLSALAILLARERIGLLGGALGFTALQSLIFFVLRHDWVGLAVAIPTGTLFYLLIWFLKDYKSSYEFPRDLTIVDLVIGLSSLALSLMVLRWI